MYISCKASFSLNAFKIRVTPSMSTFEVYNRVPLDDYILVDTLGVECNPVNAGAEKSPDTPNW